MVHDSIYLILQQKIIAAILGKLMKLDGKQRCIVVEDPIGKELIASGMGQNMGQRVSIRTNFIKMKYRRINEEKYIQLLKEISINAPFVSVLVLQGSRMSIKAIRMIVEADWKFVTLLNLAKTCINDDAIQLLSKGKWRFVRKLVLSLNHITNRGATLLARWNLANMSVLELEKTKVTFDCLKVISKAMWVRLRVLSFQGTNLGAINLSMMSKMGFQHLERLNLKSISTANIFLNCADIAKIATLHPQLRLEVLTAHTSCNSDETVRRVREVCPNLSSFGMVWGAAVGRGYPEQRIAVELSEQFSEESSD